MQIIRRNKLFKTTLRVFLAFQTFSDNAEDLDIVMLIYNLIECSKSYSNTSGSLWNYYRDEPNSGEGDENDNVNYSIKDQEFFDYKTNTTVKLEDIDRIKDVEIAKPLKYLSNLWRALDMPLINCKLSLILTWSRNCALKSKVTRHTILT